MNLSLPSRRLSVRRELWLLCRLRWQLARNSLASHLRQHYWRLLLLTTVAGLFLVGDYAFSFACCGIYPPCQGNSDRS